MRAAKMLVFVTLLLATVFAQTEWKEHTYADGNFSVLFSGTPQKQTGAERNLHEFSAKTNDESYGLAYADFPASTNWTDAINEERGTVVKHFVGKIVDEQRTSIEGHSGKFVPSRSRMRSGNCRRFEVHRVEMFSTISERDFVCFANRGKQESLS